MSKYKVGDMVTWPANLHRDNRTIYKGKVIKVNKDYTYHVVDDGFGVTSCVAEVRLKSAGLPIDYEECGDCQYDHDASCDCEDYELLL